MAIYFTFPLCLVTLIAIIALLLALVPKPWVHISAHEQGCLFVRLQTMAAANKYGRLFASCCVVFHCLLGLSGVTVTDILYTKEENSDFFHSNAIPIWDDLEKYTCRQHSTLLPLRKRRGVREKKDLCLNHVLNSETFHVEMTRIGRVRVASGNSALTGGWQMEVREDAPTATGTWRQRRTPSL